LLCGIRTGRLTQFNPSVDILKTSADSIQDKEGNAIMPNASLSLYTGEGFLVHEPSCSQGWLTLCFTTEAHYACDQSAIQKFEIQHRTKRIATDG
jgi:hypothetical protein